MAAISLPGNDDYGMAVCEVPDSVLVQRKVRASLAEEGFRPSGGDFQGMRIYLSDVFFVFWAARKLTPPVINHRPQ